jgi:hypothetical protein
LKKIEVERRNKVLGFVEKPVRSELIDRNKTVS